MKDTVDDKIDWKEIFDLYNTIKWLYALCEETDKELNTNIQPFNEFRAALDHLMRIIAIQNLDEYKNKDAYDESRKLYGHLKRAFFDICDLVAINYRNKIIDSLEEYTVTEINTAIPEYYTEIRPEIEKISNRIAFLRTEKRFTEDEESESAIDEYPEIVKRLQEYLELVNSAVPSLLEIRNKSKNAKRANLFIQWIIPIGAIVIGSIIGIIGWYM